MRHPAWKFFKSTEEAPPRPPGILENTFLSLYRDAIEGMLMEESALLKKMCIRPVEGAD